MNDRIGALATTLGRIAFFRGAYTCWYPRRLGCRTTRPCLKSISRFLLPKGTLNNLRLCHLRQVPLGSRDLLLRQSLEAACGADVVEVAEVVVDADVVEHAAEAADGDAHAVGPAEAAELAAAFEVRLQVENHAGDAALGELLFELRDDFGEVAEDALVAAVAQVGRHEVLELVFVDVLRAAG